MFDVAVSFNKTKNVLKGDLEQWKQYHDDYIVPINKILLKSNEKVFMFMRENLTTILEIITHWEVKYRPCEVIYKIGRYLF